jgi:hypothetical protein
MIFALATDEKSLLVFPTPEEAIAYCEGIDVEAGVWLFWNENGLPLQPEFLAPNHHGRFSVSNGFYRLLETQSGNSLAEMLGGIHSMGPNRFFQSLSAVAVHLARATKATRHGA